MVILPPHAACPYGVQPLHVIIKPDKKPRMVIDLSRNLNDHLQYEYFSYASLRNQEPPTTVRPNALRPIFRTSHLHAAAVGSGV